MAITITDEQIEQIAYKVEENLDIAELETSFEEIKTAVENWLLRTIYEIERNPGFYTGGPAQYGNSRVPGFEVEPRCVDAGWGRRCGNSPRSGSVYCEDHDPELEREVDITADVNF